MRALLLLLPLALAGAALAQDRTHLSADPRVIEGRSLTEQGRYAEALEILRPLALIHVDSLDINFLIGFAALELSERTEDEDMRLALLDEAIEAFLFMLNERPELIRVRLELARSFFLKGEDDLAEQHFEIVLASDIHPQIRATILDFMRRMDARSPWTGYFSFAISPSLNSGGRNVEGRNFFGGGTVDWFIAGDSRGTGIVFLAGGTYTHRINPKWDLVSSVDATRREHRGSDSDTMSLSLDSGPRYKYRQGSHIGLAAGLFREWPSDGELTDEYSLRAVISHRFDERTTAFGNATFTIDQSGNGPDKAFSVGGRYLITPLIATNWSTGITFERPKSASAHSNTAFVSGSFTFVLPLAISLDVGTRYTWKGNNNRNPIFNLGTEYDREKNREFRLGILKRDLTLFGFSPRLSLTRQVNESNFGLNDQDGKFVQVTFQRQF